MVNELATAYNQIFLARPRRFGKSLLVSTFESLFKFGIRDFKGLAIETLWKDRTYPVVRLDFSLCKYFSTAESFDQQLREMLELAFREVGFVTSSSNDSFTKQVSTWLQTLEDCSFVLLIDEYDAPLTNCQSNKALFTRVKSTLHTFYSLIARNSDCIRLLFITGITTFGSSNIFSEFHNISDISLNPKFGTLLGYTEDEILKNFEVFLKKASSDLKISDAELIQKLHCNYDGFCFDPMGKTHVYCPWSILNFLAAPSLGFQEYWFESGGQPTVLVKYLRNHALANPANFLKTQEIPLSALRASNQYDDLDLRVLLTQTGYPTIKSVTADGWVELGYPNREVVNAMAKLYSNELLKGKRLRKPDAPTIDKYLRKGNITQVIEYFNWIFNVMDYKDYPITNESQCRALLQVLLVGAGLNVLVERHTALGRSDLEINIGDFYWIFEFKFCQTSEHASDLLAAGEKQMKARKYSEIPHWQKRLRIVAAFSATDRAITAWKQLADERHKLPLYSGIFYKNFL